MITRPEEFADFYVLNAIPRSAYLKIQKRESLNWQPIFIRTLIHKTEGGHRSLG
jgi:hypothetical protein